MKTIWVKETGEALVYDTVDAREILERSPDIYTDKNPDPPDPDAPPAPQNISDVQSEYRRDPVGTNPVEHALDHGHAVIKNPTGAPRLGSAPRQDGRAAPAMEHES